MNKKQRKQLSAALVIAIGIILWSAMANAQTTWKRFDVGLDHLVIYDSIHVFRLDQDYYSFEAKGSATVSEILPAWVAEERGGINLNMFISAEVGAIPSGYTRIEGHIINPDIKSDYNLFIVWNESELTILDRTEEGMAEIMTWPNISQNIRMMKRNINGKNRWSDQPKKWSVSAIATTVDGNVLLIHSKAPYKMYEFNQILLTHLRWLRIDRMAYLEGGPESSIIIKGREKTYSEMGSYETGFNEYYDNENFWPLPWVLTFNYR